METKAMLRIRKFSWNKTHSVKITDDRSNSLPGQNSNPVNLKRSGSMNNIILGLRTEAIGNHQHQQNGGGESRRRRTQTFRLRTKKSSKSGLENGTNGINGTPNKKADHGSSDSLPKDHVDSPSHRDCNNVTSPMTRLSIFAPLAGIPTPDVSYYNVS